MCNYLCPMKKYIEYTESLLTLSSYQVNVNMHKLIQTLLHQIIPNILVLFSD